MKDNGNPDVPGVMPTISNAPLVAMLATLLGSVLIALPAVHYAPPQRQRVILQDDGQPPENGCVVTACNEWAYHAHAKLLFVHYRGSAYGHCYCVWWQDRNTFGYDWRGPVKLDGNIHDPLRIARELPVPEAGLEVDAAAFNK